MCDLPRLFCIRLKKGVLFSLLCILYSVSYAQNITTVRGVVRDSVSREKIPFVTVSFDNTTVGTFSDEEGEFRLSTRGNITSVTASILGYKPYTFTIVSGKMNVKDLLLVPVDEQLQEVIVKPQKEKYSKKDNPAVELIKKVIAHKHQNNITDLDYYQYKEFEQILFAINKFRPDMSFFKRYEFLPNYMDSSIIENKPILPFSVREKLTDVFYRKNPKDSKRIVKGYHIAGIDQVIDTEGLDAIIKEVFKNISIFDNSIELFFHPFVGPLSESSSVNFYRWYLSDTTLIDSDRYVKLDFAPFNSRDVGFTGSLYISLDSAYAVKRAVIRTPKKMNINFIDQLVIQHDFEKVNGKWVPDQERMAIDVSLLGAFDFYIDKIRSYENFEINKLMDPVFALAAPEVFEKNYLKRPKEFWAHNRPVKHQKDYRLDEMIEDMNKEFLLKLLLDGGNIISAGYIPTSKDPDVNKLDIGTLPTLYSYNSIEGNRFRLTMATTKNLHPHLFLYGYGAYGTRDNKFKYYGEATWAFNKIKNHKDEFPKHNVIVAYKYDMNTLGQRYTQSERDNIFMSLQSNSNQKMTYNRQTQVTYQKEFYGGFSFKLSGQTYHERPAGNLVFEKMDESGNIYNVEELNTTETMLSLRYAPNEKFYQQRRKRHSMPSKKTVFSLSHTIAFDGLFGGQYHYNKTSFSALKELWLAPFGKLTMSAQAEKIWGEAPFPQLITPSANSSYTIQRGSFYLVEPLEFMHDQQVSWEVYYHMGGWLFNRIPLLKVLKWREIVGFRGLMGSLSDRNNPMINHDMLLFPQRTYTTEKGKPYMEYNIGIENIFKVLRIDYVRRINYLGHPDVDKDGFRVSFELNF